MTLYEPDLTLAEAEELDAKAQAANRPTPRAAMRVLLTRDALTYDRAEAARGEALDALRTRALRANYPRDTWGRGLPVNHRDRFSLNALVEVIGKHRTTINHWLEDLRLGPLVTREGKQVRDAARARPDLLPTYDLTADTDPEAGAPA